MDRLRAINGILSVTVLLCLVVGWTEPFSPELNDLIYHKLFYLLIGVSFVIQSKMMDKKNMQYMMYAAAALCIIGAYLPIDSQYSYIKTIGLFGGVILSVINRPKQ